jgi:hypothetical protein
LYVLVVKTFLALHLKQFLTFSQVREFGVLQMSDAPKGIAISKD